MSDIKEQISQNRQEALRQLEGVRQNAYLSGEGKRQRMAELYENARQRHQALVDQHHAKQRKDLEDLHDGLFAPQFTIGQPDYQRSSIKSEYRKSLTEADEVLEDRGAEGLRRYLERAELSGDRHAARAAFAVAHSRSYEAIVNAYLESYPDEWERYQEYQALDGEIRNPDPMQQFAASYELAFVPKPEEIQNYRADSEPAPALAGGDRFYRGLGEL